MKHCKNCNKLFQPRTSEKTCSDCPTPHKTCPICGKEKGHGNKICRECDNKEKYDRAKSLGYGKWMLGRKLPKETIEKAQANIKKRRFLQKDTGRVKFKNYMTKMSNRKFFAENPRSKDPDAREKHNADWRYREWRKAVYERDDYTCCLCDKRGGKLQAHHIYQWIKYPELRYVVNNGMTVCEYSCHAIVAKMDKKEAFKLAKVPDPTEYEDETGVYRG